MKIRLVDIAHARSGDKGDTANVGVIALKPEWYPLLREQLTLDRVRAHFKGVITGDVQRYELPNLNALNFLLHGALGGGGTLSLKTDAGKGLLHRDAAHGARRPRGRGAVTGPSHGAEGMKRFDQRQLILLRIILGAIGVAVWGYGYRTDDPNVRLAGMSVLVIVLLMRWIPKRWLGGGDPPR